MTATPEKTPLDLLRAISPEGVTTYLDQRNAILDSPELQSLSKQQKLLIGIGVAAALQSSTCTLMWTRLASKEGISSKEIAEAILVSRLMKMATVNDTAAEALAWLGAQET